MSIIGLLNKLLRGLFTTTITQAEILYGIAILPPGKRRDELEKAANLMFAEDFLGRILSFDEKAARAFANIAAIRRNMVLTIAQADTQIAPICYTHQAIIATRNVADFQEQL